MRTGLVLLFLLSTPSAHAIAQLGPVTIQLQNGDSVVARHWSFQTTCVTPLRDNPGLGTASTSQSRDLRLLVNGAERVIPERQLSAIQFAWSTGARGSLGRSAAHLSLTTGERIEEWGSLCGIPRLVLEPGEGRSEWIRIYLGGPTWGDAEWFDQHRFERIIEARFTRQLPAARGRERRDSITARARERRDSLEARRELPRLSRGDISVLYDSSASTWIVQSVSPAAAAAQIATGDRIWRVEGGDWQWTATWDTRSWDAMWNRLVRDQPYTMLRYGKRAVTFAIVSAAPGRRPPR